jgi:hypothetical protein
MKSRYIISASCVVSLSSRQQEIKVLQANLAAVRKRGVRKQETKQ